MGKKENNNSEPEKSAENGTRDIFAGAFDDIPIQEIPIESESKPEPENYSDKIDPDNFFSPPSMADIPDIGKLAENNQNYAEKIDSKKSDKISENTDFEFPSFRTPSDIQEIEGVKTSVNLPWEDEDKYDEMDHLPEKNISQIPDFEQVNDDQLSEFPEDASPVNPKLHQNSYMVERKNVNIPTTSPEIPFSVAEKSSKISNNSENRFQDPGETIRRIKSRLMENRQNDTDEYDQLSESDSSFQNNNSPHSIDDSETPRNINDINSKSPPPLFEPKLPNELQKNDPELNSSYDLQEPASSDNVPIDSEALENRKRSGKKQIFTGSAGKSSPSNSSPPDEPNHPESKKRYDVHSISSDTFPERPQVNNESDEKLDPFSDIFPHDGFSLNEHPSPAHEVNSDADGKDLTSKDKMIRRNDAIDKISSFFRSIVNNITRGGNLVDRMGDLSRELQSVDESENGGMKEEIDDSEINQFISSSQNGFDADNNNNDFLTGSNLQGSDSEEKKSEKLDHFSQKTVSCSGQNRSATGGQEVFDSIYRKQSVNFGISDPETIQDLKEKINRYELNIEQMKKELERVSSSVEDLEDLNGKLESFHEDIVSTVKSEIDSSKQKSYEIQSRFDELDSVLNSVMIDNENMKENISGVNQTISEMAGSYNALISRMQKSEFKNESMFEEMNEKISRVDKIDDLESTIHDLEHNQEITNQAFEDIGATTTTVLNDLSEVYSSNEEFKIQMKNDMQGLHQEMAKITKYVENELRKMGAKSYRQQPGQNVYLTRIDKNSASMKLCMEWLEFLMQLVGRNNMPGLLSYYEELGWISDDVRIELMKYADSIDYFVEKPDWKLNPSDHVKSIWFIEKLAGVKVDRNKLSVIERDVEKVKKGTEIYGI